MTESIPFITIIATFLSTLATILITMWVNKRKVPAEVNKINADARLSNGELIEKYQAIAGKQADENIELASKLDAKETERRELMAALEKMNQKIVEMDRKHTEENLAMEKRHREEIDKLRQSFREERNQDLLRIQALEADLYKWRDWSRRLVLQLESWNIRPVPFNINDEKDKKLAGEFGPCQDTSSLEN